jgi:hypothetical protein
VVARTAPVAADEFTQIRQIRESCANVWSLFLRKSRIPDSEAENFTISSLWKLMEADEDKECLYASGE